MASYFGSAFTNVAATADSGTSTSAKMPQNVNLQHARTRTSISHLKFSSANFTTADVAYLFAMKPNDRLVSLEFAADDTGTDGAINVGVHEMVIRDGAMQFTVSDADLFASAVATNASATSWTNIMHESTTVPIEYVGRPMWEIADLGAGTYTASTDKTFVISVTPSANTTAAFDMVFKATYVAGD